MKTLIPLVFSVISCLAVCGQSPSLSREVVASAGDYFVSPAGSLSWTLGETVIETFENGSISIILTQGFQQPDEKKDTTIGIWEPSQSNVFAILYPNPAVQSIAMDIKYDKNSRITVELVDLLGRMLHAGNLDVLKGQLSNYRLDVSALSAGMYIFRLTDNGSLLNSYKFQKLSD